MCLQVDGKQIVTLWLKPPEALASAGGSFQGASFAAFIPGLKHEKRNYVAVSPGFSASFPYNTTIN
ncbi:MAG: hypothetical protein ACHBN1_21675 [Heteroscytonema crispum UTEX LB 1556]